jgi:hypothetical protein
VRIGIDADQMTEGEKWLTIEIDATATTLNVAGEGVGWPRYPGNAIPRKQPPRRPLLLPPPRFPESP